VAKIRISIETFMFISIRIFWASSFRHFPSRIPTACLFGTGLFVIVFSFRSAKKYAVMELHKVAHPGGFLVLRKFQKAVTTIPLANKKPL